MTKTRRLSTLVQQIPFKPLSAVPQVSIRGVVGDSRQVRPGFAFVAIQGEHANGMDYLPQAASNGAVVAISDQPAPVSTTLPFLQVSGDPRELLAWLAAAFYRFPSRRLRLIGVTGTDGKTTTTTMIHHILTQNGLAAGMISTVSAVIGNQALDTGFHVTTPEAQEIQSYLAEMAAQGMTHCVLETTSHGLAQGRVAACDFDIAVITNVTHEHLDYHGNYQNYLETKGKLFAGLASSRRKRIGSPRLAVLNKDDQSYGYLKRVSPPSQVSYSAVTEADVWADGFEAGPDGLAFDCHAYGKTAHVRSGLAGMYNVSNALAAIAAVTAGLGMPLEAACAAVETFSGVPGRMERIAMGQNFTAIVDFAHTPNALERALETARSLTQGRVLVVFGSAGLRDREKRRIMPRVAVRAADLTFLTAEDPRTEALDLILEDMAQAATEAGGVEGETFWRVPDRGEAIRQAVRQAKPGDLLIVCGKGHEQSMCFGMQEYPWDDRTAMRAALAELLGVSGPQMPVLPTSAI